MREVKHLMNQLEELGLEPHVSEFQGIAQEYIRHGRSCTGAILLPSFTGKALIYELSEKQDIPCTMVLKNVATNS